MTVALLAVVRLQCRTNMPKDVFQNSFAFQAADASDASTDHITASLAAFYQSFAVKMSPCLDPLAAQQIRFYNIQAHLDGSPHGNPIRTTSLLLTGLPGGVTPMPSEVAICLSIKAAGGGGVTPGPQPIPTDDRAQDEGAPPTHTGFQRLLKRQLGRLFLGPWNTNVLAPDAFGVGHVAPSTITAIKAAATALRIAEAGWSVWSRRSAGIAPVTSGFIDDKFDSQRMRGEVATTRSNWT
jgi:hypothetical protein